MAGDFGERIDILKERVGSGKIVARVRVDQPYAKYQHERMDLKHPEGGKAHYLRDPLFLGRFGYLQRVARTVLNRGPQDAMVTVANDIATGVYEQAPFEFGDLKASASPSVIDRGRRVYNRPANKSRLTRQELRFKYRLRALSLGNQTGGRQ